jgi:hypothetical protein
MCLYLKKVLSLLLLEIKFQLQEPESVLPKSEGEEGEEAVAELQKREQLLKPEDKIKDKAGEGLENKGGAELQRKEQMLKLELALLEQQPLLQPQMVGADQEDQPITQGQGVHTNSCLGMVVSKKKEQFQI